MKKIIILFILISFTSYAQIPANYYDSANGLTGYALKSELSDIISNGHIDNGYDDLYNGYETTDSDNYYENDGTVLDMYSENPNGSDPYNYTHGNGQCGNYSIEGDCYNREHLIPQSWFNSASPMVSDIHHVVPSDGKVNGQRGHYPLANVGSATWTSLNGSKRGNCSDTGYSGIVFEPIDEFKGDIARIYFYMATRYETEIGSWENANSDGSDPVLDGTSDHVFEDWYLNVLIQWHNADPVSQREIDRNNAAYDYQGNANPFISYPEWVNTIWNPVPDDENPTPPTDLTASNTTSETTQLSWTAATDNVGVANYKIYKDDNEVGSTAATTFTVTSLNPTTTYNFYVKAYDGALNASTESNTVSVTTLATTTYIFEENFDNCPTMLFSFYSEQSNKNWECITQYGEDNSPAVQMNGYQEDVTSKDWLITTNKIPFDQYDNEKLSVYLIYKYGDMSLDLVYSTDYDGVSNPADYTWVAMPNININTSTGDTENTQQITNADISALNQPAYVAFKYYSSTAPTRWTVDSFKISVDDVNAINDTHFNDVSIFPNPTHDKLHIQSNTKITHISMYTYLGQLVLTSRNTNTITVSSLEKGFYLCKITNEFGQIITKKIIVN